MVSSSENFNRYFNEQFSCKGDTICAKLPLAKYPPRVQQYIEEMVGTIEALLGKDTISSVILFGSLSYGKITSISDVDLLIVINDIIPRVQLRKIEGILTALEVKHHYSAYTTNVIMKIMYVIEKSTGMFCSHFICRKHDWMTSNFARIFSTNTIVTNLLAPNQIVLDSMKAGATLLYGYDPIVQSTGHYSAIQILKSMVMNVAISVGSLVLLPFNPQNMKYVLESVKWSLRSSYFFLFRKIAPLKEITQEFEVLGFSHRFLSLFQELRNNLKRDYWFAFRVPIKIVSIHLAALKYRKLLRQ